MEFVQLIDFIGKLLLPWRVIRIGIPRQQKEGQMSAKEGLGVCASCVVLHVAVVGIYTYSSSTISVHIRQKEGEMRRDIYVYALYICHQRRRQM